MTFPPAVVRFRMVENGRRKIGLWLPVFLLWPIVILIVLVSIPLLLVLRLAFWWQDTVRWVLRSLFLVFPLVFSLRGFAIEFEDEQDQVIIKIM